MLAGWQGAAILLLMQTNPAEEWQRLTEHYRGMFDGELEQMAASPDDLTETAQQVLRNELRNRGMAEPETKTKTSLIRDSEPNAPEGIRWASAIDPDAGAGSGSEDHLPDGPDFDAGDGASAEFSWKTPLCECDSKEQALAICEMLRQAKLDCWYEGPGQGWSIGAPRVIVSADQLEEARQIASQPIPQSVLDDLRTVVPEYEAPRCPDCHAEDPVLESAEPTNNWLCEACGRQWSEPVAAEEGQSAPTSRQGA